MFTIKSIYIHKGCQHLKNLKEETDYPLGHKLASDFFAPRICVSAIVGQNGAGKSSLLDLMFRMINNLGFCLFRAEHRSAADLMTYVEDIYADLTYVLYKTEYTLMCRGGFVALQYRDRKIKFPLVRIEADVQQEWYDEFKYYTAYTDVPFEVQKEVSKAFFYTVATNYSMQSFIAQDYSSEHTFTYDPEKVLNNGKVGDFIYEHKGSWLNNLFHKNDGYMVPIVLNPYRTDGWINMGNEEVLTVSRMMAILIDEDKDCQFLDGYKLNRIEFSLQPRVLQQKFVDPFTGSKSYPSDEEVDAHNNNLKPGQVKQSYSGDSDLESFLEVARNRKTIAYAILTTLRCGVRKNMNPLDLFLREYIVYKVLSVAEKYPTYSLYKNALGNINLVFDYDTNIERAALAKQLAKDVLRDNTHIGLKVRQTLKFIRKAKGLDNSWFTKRFKYDDYADVLGVKGKKMSIEQRMEYLPSSIFHAHIYLDKVDSMGNVIKKGIPLNHLSSGERQFIYMMSTLVYHALNLKSVAKKRNRISYHNLNLVLDEVEICFHPELQRQFIGKFISLLTRMEMNKYFNINILLTTHSPFILSDIPTENLLCLKDGKPDEGKGVLNKTFCANVYDLLNNHFFMHQYVGDFAAKKLDVIVDRINQGELTMGEFHKLEKDIEMIGDEFISASLLEQLQEHKPNRLDELHEKEKQMMDELRIIKKRIKELERNDTNTL